VVEDVRSLRWEITIRIAGREPWNLRQDLREPLNAGLAIEALEDAGPAGLEPPSPRAPGSDLVRGVGRSWSAVAREGSHHGCPDRDVRAGVEKVGGLSIEPGRPGDRDRHETQRRPATLLGDRRRELQHLVGRCEVVVGHQRYEVPEEERIRVGHPADERLDELIVRVKAAREDDGQEVHNGLATVSASIGTGPK
jgi:hypothetical protein